MHYNILRICLTLEIIRLSKYFSTYRIYTYNGYK